MKKTTTKKPKSKTLERIGLEDLSSNQDQLNRYELAVRLIKNLKIKNAIDCACGVGYGTELLSNHVGGITGVDIDKEAIQISKKHKQAKNAKYYCSSIFDFKHPPVDLFVSFETIEHVPDGKLFLKKIKSLLRKNGTLILSTPNGRITTPWKGKPRNKYHLIEYFPEDLISLISEFFTVQEIYGQYPKSGFTYFMNVINSNIFINWLVHLTYQSLWKFYKKEDKPTIVNTTMSTVFKKRFNFSTNIVIVAKNKHE